jgi:hypothetical protein
MTVQRPLVLKSPRLVLLNRLNSIGIPLKYRFSWWKHSLNR